MKTLLCQINTTPGDLSENVRQIKYGIEKGFKLGVDLIVFPELSIPGYLMRDMIFDSNFIEKNLAVLEEVKSFYAVMEIQYNVEPPHVVLGYADYNRIGYGKPFRNMAAVIHRGAIIGTYAKQLLPFYDVFDEGRYFQPGSELCVIKINGNKWGICICEDVWNDKGSDDYNYKNNPIQQYRDIGVQNIISINSSPFVQGKIRNRINMLKHSTLVRGGVGGGKLIYVNQIGGQDELVFDGNSFVVENGQLTGFASEAFLNCDKNFEDRFVLYDDKTKNPGGYGAHALDYKLEDKADQHLYSAILIGFRDYAIKSGFSRGVFMSSGGIDSAVVGAFACEIFGPVLTHGIRAPSRWSSDGSKDDALRLHQNLGCHDHLVSIDHQPWIDQIIDGLSNTEEHIKLIARLPYNSVADENIQARMRGTICMHFSNAFGALPVTTGNKTELALGYCTLYGDMNGGFAPINGLYKLDVYRLARYINQRAGKEVIPQAIIDKAPSAELAPNQTDEGSLLPYPILDPIVRACIEDRITDFQIFCRSAYGRETEKWWKENSDSEAQYNRMMRLIKNSEFKRRQAAPGIKVNRIDFGTGRRYPIVKR